MNPPQSPVKVNKPNGLTAPVSPRAPGAGAPSSLATPPAPLHERLLDGLVSFFTSMRLTVACLIFGMALVFFGTLAQVDLGLYKAQNAYFRSFVVYWGPNGASWKMPVLPGGYLVGGVLLLNLVASHFQRFKFSRDKAGIWLIHVGLILLLVGQLLTDLLARESSLHLREGQTKNYSEAGRQVELAIIDTSEGDLDKVVAIPQRLLMGRKEIQHPELPFVVRVNQFFGNSAVDDRPPGSTEPAAASQGIGSRATVKALPHVTEMDQRDIPSAVVEIITPQGPLGTWLVSEYVQGQQQVTVNGRRYELVMRPRRYYAPFSIHLLEFRHDLYPGTQIPKNFSSRVRLQRPDTGENREVLIYMNNPLRYSGETYYQSGFDPDNKGTILQVVRNPSWLTPYVSCILVGVGLVVQFAIHLLGFTLKRRTA